MKRVMMVSVNGKARFYPKWCKHERMFEVESGGWSFSAGGVDDSYKIVQHCPDCGYRKELDGSELPG